jgi:hypothetical protein
MASHNICLSSWDTLYIYVYVVWAIGSVVKGREIMGYGSRRTPNQEWMCWRGPAAIYQTVSLNKPQINEK